MRYQVVGRIHKVFGKGFGEHFERNLPEAQERHLIGGGFIVRAPNKEQPRPSEAVVLVKEPSAANDDAPNDVPDGASTEPPEGMSTDEQEAYSA